MEISSNHTASLTRYFTYRTLGKGSPIRSSITVIGICRKARRYFDSFHVGGAFFDIVDAAAVLAGNDLTGVIITSYLTRNASNHLAQVASDGNRSACVQARGLTDCDLGSRALVDSAMSSEDLEKTYFCMPISYYRNERREAVTKGPLLENTGIDEDSYQRIGLFSISLKYLPAGIRQCIIKNIQLQSSRYVTTLMLL
jgi:hypothetical protein